MIVNTIWLAGGAASGAVYVWLLRRAARPPFRAAAVTAPLRMLFAVSLFLLAGWRHELPATAGGFAAAFAVTTLAYLCRNRSATWSVSKSSKNM